jgi:hypothetical protein
MELHKMNRPFDKETDKFTEPLRSIWRRRQNTNVVKSFFNLVGVKQTSSSKTGERALARRVQSE